MKHYLSKDLTAPQRTSVKVHLVGCGGTGSQMLTGLARLHTALLALGHPGFKVIVHDPDTVSESNVGRQLFSPADIGHHKAIVLVTRINQYYGLDWKAYPFKFTADSSEDFPDLLITAVDTVKSRLLVPKWIAKWEDGACYWLDTGNTRRTGQVVLGTLGEDIPQPVTDDSIGYLRCVTDLYDLKKVKEKDQGPSCSLAAALEQQDLMINQMVATCALQLLWQGFRQGYVENHGAFIDLESMKVTPLPVDPALWERMQS